MLPCKIPLRPRIHERGNAISWLGDAVGTLLCYQYRKGIGQGLFLVIFLYFINAPTSQDIFHV